MHNYHFLTLFLLLMKPDLFNSQPGCIGNKCRHDPYDCDSDDNNRICDTSCCIEGRCALDNVCKKPNTLILVLIIVAVVVCILMVLLNYWRRIRLQRQRNMRRAQAQNGARGNLGPASPNDPVWQHIEYEKGVPLREGPAKPAYELHSISRIEYGEIQNIDQWNNERKTEANNKLVNSPGEVLSFRDIIVKADNENENQGIVEDNRPPSSRRSEHS